MRKIAIIGGSGVYNPETLQGFKKLTIDTPYGQAECTHGVKDGNEVTFISRHGVGHTVPPHMINYRANIYALKTLGVEEILGTAAVGSLNKDMQAGHFVVCDQILDFTKNRINTFFDGNKYPVGHADFTNPYCPSLRKVLITCLQNVPVVFHNTGTMVVTEGPRFETPAEIKMYAQLGGDVVNMTSMPEAILAREAEMHYACIATVTNMAAGISANMLSHAEVLETMAKTENLLGDLIDRFIAYSGQLENLCNCEHTMQEYGGFKL